MINPFLESRFILTLILINSGVIFWQCYDGYPKILDWVDLGFVICFWIEMISKWKKYTFWGYWSRSWGRFDGAITILSSMSVLQMFFAYWQKGVLSPSVTTGMSLEFLIALRVLRVFRFFRVFRFIPSIESIVTGTRNALLSSYVIVFAFMTLAFIFSVVSCCLFKSVSPDYFGDPITSFYTIFRLFTVEGWYEIPEAVSANFSFWGTTAVKLYFASLLFFGGIIGMSFINSIIVDAMVSDNNDQMLAKINGLEKKIDLLLEEKGLLNKPEIIGDIKDSRE